MDPDPAPETSESEEDDQVDTCGCSTTKIDKRDWCAKCQKRAKKEKAKRKKQA